MKLILENEKFEHYQTIFINATNIERYLLDINSTKIYLNATLFTYDKIISCIDLIQIRDALNKSNIKLNCIVTSSRETNISAINLKIKSDFDTLKNEKYNFNISSNNNSPSLTHEGIVRSGEKISSNGNLIIIGDVNPGAQISAKGNIYVWGKLCGIAIAGRDGEDNCFIASLYLNPLQLRINNKVAIGPKEKPIDHYPEIALLNKGKIVIKPLLINN